MTNRFRIHAVRDRDELVITRSPLHPPCPLPVFDVAGFDFPDFARYRRRPFDYEVDR